MPELSILMPVFNERETIRSAVDELLAGELPVSSLEIVLVDDGSTDGTRELLRESAWPSQVRIVEHDRNRGKGAALRTALAHAEGTWSAVMDADLEYEPAGLATVLEPLLEGRAEAVFGTRAFESHSAYSFWYVVGNKAVTVAANFLFNCWLSDIMTCQKAMSTRLFRSLGLREDGFAVEPEITARLLLGGVRIYEVPIAYSARTRAEGKKLTGVDGLRTLRSLIGCRLRLRPGSLALERGPVAQARRR